MQDFFEITKVIQFIEISKYTGLFFLLFYFKKIIGNLIKLFCIFLNFTGKIIYIDIYQCSKFISAADSGKIIKDKINKENDYIVQKSCLIGTYVYAKISGKILICNETSKKFLRNDDLYNIEDHLCLQKLSK